MRIQTARKDHICGECQGKIPKGHLYWRNDFDCSGSYVSAEKTHTNCLDYEDDLVSRVRRAGE